VLYSGLRYLRGETGQKWLLTLADQGIASAGSFLVTVIIGRACAREQLGLYFLGLSILGLLMEFQNVLIWSPFTALSPRIKGCAHARYFGSTFVHQWVFSGFSILALAGTGFFLSRGWGSPGLGPVVWALAIVGSFITFQQYARRICLANLQIKAAFLLDSGTTLIQVGALLLLAYLGKLSAIHAFEMIGLATFLAALLWFLWARKGLAFSKTSVVSDLGHNWAFGKWLLGGNLALFLGCQIYPWILNGLHGTTVVAALAACQGVVALVNPFLQGTTNFLAPKATRAFAQGGAQGLLALVRKSTLAIIPVTVLFCLGFFAFGSRLASFIYGAQYANLGPVITLLALNVLIASIAIGVDYGIWAMGRTDLNFSIELARLLITCTIGLWLVKDFGLLGVAWGLLLGSIVVLVIRAMVFKKLISSTPKN
jgi:O-antigen/teichoic acid export membrane protein